MVYPYVACYKLFGLHAHFQQTWCVDNGPLYPPHTHTLVMHTSSLPFPLPLTAASAFLGPFIGAAIAILLLLLVIAFLLVLLFYTIWKRKKYQRSRLNSSGNDKKLHTVKL